MCDYSLMHSKSRPAAVGDKLTVYDMGSRTHGLTESEFAHGDNWGSMTAVCLLPGTEVAFNAPVKRHVPDGAWRSQEVVEMKSSVGIFCQMDKENLFTHHDAFEFAEDHDRVLINHLVAGQTLTVLQLPAAPKTKVEAEAQERVAIVG
jgi:hypothetical protein